MKPPHRRIRCIVQLVLSAAMFHVANQANAAETVFVAAGSEWSFLDDGSDQGTLWQGASFDDLAWSSGPAQLGYGDGDEATVVGFGLDANNKFITTYFRHTFEVTDPSLFIAARVRLLRDDGAVVYLNGAELVRSNMPVGDVTYTTLASRAVSGASEGAFLDLPFDPGMLVSGTNVLAVEIHQSGPTSSDISFDLELLGGDGAPFVDRGPYLQLGTPTSVILRWRTDVALTARVQYGLDPNALTESMDDPAEVRDRVFTLTGLQPDTKYYYSVGTQSDVLQGGDLDHFFVTAPLPGTAKPTRVWVIGDSGTADANAAAVRNAYADYTASRGTDVWLMLGDNAYDSGTGPEYQAAVFGTYPEMLRKQVVWATLGNHDARSADSPTESGPYYRIFDLPREGEAGGLASGTEAYYSFDYGNIHFVCLDSQDTIRAVGGAMMTWLAADLDATLQDWIVAYWHHPPYTKGSHNSDNAGDSSGRMRDMRQIALPILEAGGVDLVLSGHSHSYERSFLIDGHYGLSGSLAPRMILNGGDGAHNGDGAYAKPSIGPAVHEGAVYIVAGSSGKIGGGPLNHPVMHVSMNRLGSVVLDVDGLQLDAVFLDSNGNERDSFRIVKGEVDCLADVDLDGWVSLSDLAIQLSHFGQSTGVGYYDGDLDGDGDVDMSDLEAMLEVFATICS